MVLEAPWEVVATLHVSPVTGCTRRSSAIRRNIGMCDQYPDQERRDRHRVEPPRASWRPMWNGATWPTAIDRASTTARIRDSVMSRSRSSRLSCGERAGLGGVGPVRVEQGRCCASSEPLQRGEVVVERRELGCRGRRSIRRRSRSEVGRAAEVVGDRGEVVAHAVDGDGEAGVGVEVGPDRQVVQRLERAVDDAGGVGEAAERGVDPVERRRDVLGEVGDDVERGGRRRRPRCDRVPSDLRSVSSVPPTVAVTSWATRSDSSTFVSVLLDEAQAGGRAVLEVAEQPPGHDRADDAGDRGDHAATMTARPMRRRF